MLWLALRFPSLPLDVFSCQSPDQALAVRAQHRVLMASARARQQGVVEGMKVATALSLCGTLQLHQRDLALEQERLQALARRMLFVTPGVCLDAPDTLLLDIGGSLLFFGGLEKLLQAVDASLAGTSRWHMGIGHTPLCATLLVSHPIPPALPASTAAQRDFFVSRLHPLLINDLPLQDTWKRRLTDPGLETLGDVLALPRQALGKRYGKGLLDWLQRLLGEKPDPRHAIAPPLRFQAEVEFDEPVEHTQGLLFPAQRLLQQMDAFLRQRQLSTRAIRWHITDSRRHSRQLVLRRASDSGDLSLWQDLTLRRFEQTQLEAPVIRLALDCARPRQQHRHSQNLFSDNHNRSDRLALLERLAALPQLQLSFQDGADTHVPEMSQQQRPALSAEHTGVNVPGPYQDLPLWLLENPLPLKKQGPQLFWQGSALELLPGEQRLHSDWWQQPVLRHYRMARHPSGTCCWIFRDQNRRWFLHGFF